MPDQSSASTKRSSDQESIDLAGFVNSVPPPLTITLVRLSPHITWIRRIIEITSWKSSWQESWLLIAVWWALCLLVGIGKQYVSSFFGRVHTSLTRSRIRHVIPVLVVVALAWLRWRSRSVSPPPPVTGKHIHLIVSDLTRIQELAPAHRNVPLPPLPVLLRVTAVLYVPYSILVFLVRLRVIIAVTGTFILTWNAPWAVAAREGLWGSAWLRWSVYHLWSFISGQPLPPPSQSYPVAAKSKTKADPKANETAVAPAEPMRFLFTIFENQRWWMGLDWTAALLPQERPAWATSSEEPISPPSAFVLPPPTTVYLPHEKSRAKHAATWTWEEDEWRVLRKLEGSSTSRVERPLPSLKEEVPSNRLLKAAGMMKDAKDAAQPNHEKKDKEKEEEEHSESDEPLTDADGWIYADNKWEGSSGRAGMGKVCTARVLLPSHESNVISYSTRDIGGGHG
jgi:hypothetical protein